MAKRVGWLALCLGIAPACLAGAAGVASGELKTWHRVTLSFQGPRTREGAAPNPFRDVRLTVTFAKGTRRIAVPGYYAADGRAAHTGATSGRIWRAHFAPDEAGEWTYVASFRTGSNIAIDPSPTAGRPLAFDGARGTFRIAPTDKTGRDHRAKGCLRYVGNHYLRFAATGEWFLKGGADSPENFLAYADFDDTPPKHRYQPHLRDWRPADPTWRGTRGKGIVGALNYLASTGMNSVYMLTMNVGGDGKDVWPWTRPTRHTRFDCSKLDQWEIVFSHMDRLGLMLHLITQETENDQLLDGGRLGLHRKLYYRELIARFAHHLALVWNLGEENTNTPAQRNQFARFIRALDPYRHPIVVHTFPGRYDQVYTPLLGAEHFEGPSLQTNDTHRQTLRWVARSADAGRKWVVCLDEIGPPNAGVKPDTNDPSHDAVRTRHLWGNLMAGGAGCEWYFGYKFPHSDLTCEDWRSRDQMWRQTRIALDFFRHHLPFAQMRPADALVSGNAWCFAKPGYVYAITLPTGGTTSLDLGKIAAPYRVQWFDPRNGGPLQAGSLATIRGPGRQAIGQPPREQQSDWAALVSLPDGVTIDPADAPRIPGPLSDAKGAVVALVLINADTNKPIGSLRDGATLDLAKLPTHRLNVRADTKPAAVGSVRFALDANRSFRTENAAPYALAGDSAGVYHPWTPAAGRHTLTATPHPRTGARGPAGKALTVRFTVVGR